MLREKAEKRENAVCRAVEFGGVVVHCDHLASCVVDSPLIADGGRVFFIILAHFYQVCIYELSSPFAV